MHPGRNDSGGTGPPAAGSKAPGYCIGREEILERAARSDPSILWRRSRSCRISGSAVPAPNHRNRYAVSVEQSDISPRMALWYLLMCSSLRHCPGSGRDQEAATRPLPHGRTGHSGAVCNDVSERDPKMIFMDNFHQRDYSASVGCSLAFDLSSSIPDGFFYGILQFRIEEGMIEHRESTDEGNRLEYGKRRFPLPGWFGTRSDHLSRSILPDGNIPVSLGIPDFPYDGLCREHSPQVRTCRCRASRCRSVQKRGSEDFTDGAWFRAIGWTRYPAEELTGVASSYTWYCPVQDRHARHITPRCRAA
jgi:hypothetical protein